MSIIKIFLNKTESRLLANADVTFESPEYGPVTAKYFQIWRSQFMNKKLDNDKINIEPPSTRSNPNVIKCEFLRLENENKWFELMYQIYSAYKDAVKAREGIETESISV
jgi:hypothetical protein